MVSSLDVSLSGFNAANARLQNAATNIANQSSTRTRVDGESRPEPFVPQDAVQSTNEGGSVRTEFKPRENATVKLFKPDDPNADESGFVEAPNVDTAEELVNAKIASYDAKANLTLIAKQDELFKSALDIIA